MCAHAAEIIRWELSGGLTLYGAWKRGVVAVRRWMGRTSCGMQGDEATCPISPRTIQQQSSVDMYGAACDMWRDVDPRSALGCGCGEPTQFGILYIASNSMIHHFTPPIMVKGVQILSKVAQQAQNELFTDGALEFLAALHRTFESTRRSLLVAREEAQRRFDAGTPLDFPPETAHIRAEPSWLCAPPAPGLEDRRVEITGPTDRKMVINALNSGAKTFMADFEGV